MGASRSSGQVLVRNLIERTGAVRTGHFKIGPYHSGSWISDKLLLAKALHLANLGRYLATQVLAAGCPTPDAVIGLAPDGIALVQAVGAPLAAARGEDEMINQFVSLYVDERYDLPPEYEALLQGRNVVVVQSVIFTGKVMARLMNIARSHGGTVVAGAALITRGQVARQAIGDVPTITLYDYSSDDRLEAECLDCAQGVPLLDPQTMLPTS